MLLIGSCLLYRVRCDYYNTICGRLSQAIFYLQEPQWYEQCLELLKLDKLQSFVLITHRIWLKIVRRIF